MKDNHTVGKKWPKKVVKKPFTSIIHFYSDYSWWRTYFHIFLTPNVIKLCFCQEVRYISLKLWLYVVRNTLGLISGIWFVSWQIFQASNWDGQFTLRFLINEYTLSWFFRFFSLPTHNFHVCNKQTVPLYSFDNFIYFADFFYPNLLFGHMYSLFGTSESE